MKIQVVSDLHLEFSDITIPNVGSDVLILSGDILVSDKLFKEGSEVGGRFRAFLQRCSDTFPHVIWVAGNHEFYGSGDFFGHVDRMREWCQTHYSNVYFLERDTKVIDDILFVGATLWTDMNKGDPLTVMHCRDLMNDYRAIRNDHDGYRKLTPNDTVQRHHETKRYFETVIDQAPADQKVVVVAHHTPSWQSCAEQFRGDYLMNGAFHNSMEDFILDRPKIRLWTHGHTHWAFDYMLGETRVVCNPRGYETYKDNEVTNWDISKVIEI
jgi:Icc-related predicted phosphoesterase